MPRHSRYCARDEGAAGAGLTRSTSRTKRSRAGLVAFIQAARKSGAAVQAASVQGHERSLVFARNFFRAAMVEEGVIKPDMKRADIQNWLKARRPWACAARPTTAPAALHDRIPAHSAHRRLMRR